ncbi:MULTISPECIES: outer membrane protein assembly factor BamB [unclassified Polaromonas]|uniref:outer membrane protein assembly factor BamB n=1 Tax=unclassified Polaromonas TaxID=2638319 RepID=UPI000F0947B2|nr:MULTISPECIES: outer membrane protein assembly factor BamB [unclassified Polaromonas]AYQ29746.1 outer membrane protein assembly factor BamB [Polaromonas sp. SP1]QGJ19138.1 outer membrane protein assembly factor BamB [Polaromonas sp. Pch-P]
MIYQSFRPLAQAARPLSAIVLIAALGGCSFFGGGPVKPQPAELQPVSALVSARQVWSSRVGKVDFPLETGVSGTSVAIASGDGTVALLDTQTGRDFWRLALNTPLAAGAGNDGKVVAVVSKANEVIALQGGKELWRQKLVAQAFTAPFVAGGRVFVLAADRSVNAFDGQNGRKLWTQQRPNEPLILRQSGVMLAVGDTLVVGLGGRLVGLNPTNGSVRWEAPIATPRGINDVERLVDMVGRVSRQGDVVCARAFQASVGCVNAARGSLIWAKPANGVEGVDGDDRLVFGSEADGTVNAWRRTDGERAWSTDRLRYRSLSAPVVVGRSIAIGDFAGYIHLLSREDGSLLNRLPTDGTAIAATPVLAGNTLIAVTQGGGIYGFQPQ